MKEFVPQGHDVLNDFLGRIIIWGNGNAEPATKDFYGFYGALGFISTSALDELFTMPFLCHLARFIFNPAAKIGELRTGIEDHVFDGELLPVPFIHRRPAVHVERVGEQSPFFLLPNSPHFVGMREEVLQRGLGKGNVVAFPKPSGYAAIKSPVRKLESDPEQIPE